MTKASRGGRGAWVAATIVALGGCTTLLGVDKDYHGAAGVAKLGDSCADQQQLACAGNAQRLQLICGSDHTWQGNGTCDGTTNCDTAMGPNQGTCGPVVAECLGKNAGDMVCAGVKRVKCGPDLVTTEEVETCLVACLSGQCSTATGGDPCSPAAACPQVASSKCIALEDNSAAKAFTLRMANLTLTAPPALTKGLVKGVVLNGVTMNLASCNLNGGGTFSWLLQFDTATGKLKTGGGTPAEDPTKGYSFVDKTISQGGKDFKITPFTADAPIGKDGAFAVTTGQNVTVPVYLDLKASAVLLLPLHDAKLTGTVSADNNCIGEYNSKNLDPAGGCLADDKTPSFIGTDGKADSDGKLDGYITLEEADTVIVDAVGESLCVMLSGDAALYGNGATPTLCKRDAMMKITFQGDWCDPSNDTACKDSVRLTANFSASGVKSPATP